MHLPCSKGMKLGKGLHPAPPETLPPIVHHTVWWDCFVSGFFGGGFLPFVSFVFFRVVGLFYYFNIVR